MAGHSQQGMDLVAQLDEHGRSGLAQALGGADDVGGRALRNPQQRVAVVVGNVLHLRLGGPAQLGEWSNISTNPKPSPADLHE